MLCVGKQVLHQVAVKYYKSDLPGIIPSKLSNIHCLFFESLLGIIIPMQQHAFF
jgi:hypothetical protein